MGYKHGWEHRQITQPEVGLSVPGETVYTESAEDPTAQLEINSLLDLLDGDYETGSKEVKDRLQKLNDSYLEYLQDRLTADPRLPEGIGHISDLDIIISRQLKHRQTIRDLGAIIP